MKVGAILFDISNNTTAKKSPIVSLGTAWASIGGGTARRVKSIHELPNDVIWLTNLTYNNFFRVGLMRHPNFRSDGWLRTLFGQLVTELGVGFNQASPDETVSVISTISQRVINLARARHNIEPKSPRLNEDFAEVLETPRCNIDESCYSYFESIANHPSVCVIKTLNHNVSQPTLTVRRNRLRHAKDILSTSVPINGEWEMENIGDKGTDDSWLCSLENPFLVRCTLSNIKPVISEILSWGGGSSEIREWLTDVEWRTIRQYAKVNVKSVLYCNKIAASLGQGLLPDGMYDELSFTNGMVAEQIWTAFSIKQPFRSEKRYTAAAAWLRSTDRMIMFDLAQKLHSKGLNVLSYGVGNIVLRLPENGLMKALDIVTDLGLAPPLNITQRKNAMNNHEFA